MTTSDTCPVCRRSDCVQCHGCGGTGVNPITDTECGTCQGTGCEPRWDDLSEMNYVDFIGYHDD